MQSDAESYLYWLKSTDLDTASLEERTLAVKGALNNLNADSESQDETSECAHVLKQILHSLHSGDLATQALKSFREEFLQSQDNQPEQELELAAARLEHELRELAFSLSQELWATETYQKLENAIHSYCKGESEANFWDSVDDIEEVIEKAYASYSAISVLPKEITMESQIVHDLLLEAIELWRTSLLAISGSNADEEPPWDDILAQAESANRLLVAIQVYNGRLQEAKEIV